MTSLRLAVDRPRASEANLLKSGSRSSIWDEPDHRLGREAVLDDFAGRQEGGRVERQQADPVEGNRPAQRPRGGQ